MRPIEKDEKTAPGRQLTHHRQKCRWIARCAIGDAHAELHHHRIVDQAFLLQLLGEDTRWPVSNTSISGRTPSDWIRLAMARSIDGVLVMT